MFVEQYSNGTAISFSPIPVLKSLKEVEFYCHLEGGNESNLLFTVLKLSDWTSFLFWNWSSDSKNASNISYFPLFYVFSFFYWYSTDLSVFLLTHLQNNIQSIIETFRLSNNKDSHCTKNEVFH